MTWLIFVKSVSQMATSNIGSTTNSFILSDGCVKRRLDRYLCVFRQPCKSLHNFPLLLQETLSCSFTAASPPQPASLYFLERIFTRPRILSVSVVGVKNARFCHFHLLFSLKKKYTRITSRSSSDVHTGECDGQPDKPPSPPPGAKQASHVQLLISAAGYK